jgi:hypothetical protein
MGKITKKKFDKHFKDACKKKHKKKTLRKEIDELVKSIAIDELEKHGDDGMEKIVIDNVSIEILSELPSTTESGVQPEGMAAAAAASSNCFYYCYVIGGTRICRKICW